MGLLTSRLARLRSDPSLLRLPPYISLLCIVGGLVWILLLPLDQYHRRTYISENALLPGQVHTYFHSSEQNIYRGYKHEVANILEPTPSVNEDGQQIYLVATEGHRNDRIDQMFRTAGIKTARQKFTYTSLGQEFSGENVYAVVHGPRADGTESIVLIAPARNAENQLNVKGVTLLITLARYFSRWSLWSKDIILLVTPDTLTGPQAWVDAYHSMHDPDTVSDLSLKSGHIQGVVAIDYPFDHNFESLHVSYDGVNGQLPNLDLINTAISIASGQMGIPSTIQGQHHFTAASGQDKYFTRVQTMVRGMISQGLGHATGAHSAFMPYHIDAITLTAVGNGVQDEMAFGRTIESVTRSLNNLLEKLHQSFFFYLLIQNTKFVSIGTYLPSAMAIGAAFTIVAIATWIRGGYEEQTGPGEVVTKSATTMDATTQSRWVSVDRHLTLPIGTLAAIHLLSLLAIYLFTKTSSSSLLTSFTTISLLTMSIPLMLGPILVQKRGHAEEYAAHAPKPGDAEPGSTKPLRIPHAASKTFIPTREMRTSQFFCIFSSLSLLVLGLELTVIATLNFSLSMFLGLACTPLAFAGYNSSPNDAVINRARNFGSLAVLLILSPPFLHIVVAAADIYYFNTYRAPVGVIGRLKEYLEAQAFAWNVWTSWGTVIGIWAVWTPAWIVGMASVAGSLFTPSIALEKGGKIKVTAVSNAGEGQKQNGTSK